MFPQSVSKILSTGGTCIEGGGMHGRGCAWWGGVVGGCAWRGGMHGEGHVWQGAFMAGGPTPPPQYYEMRSMSGQYASYWNAFLLEQEIKIVTTNRIIVCDSICNILFLYFSTVSNYLMC